MHSIALHLFPIHEKKNKTPQYLQVPDCTSRWRLLKRYSLRFFQIVFAQGSTSDKQTWHVRLKQYCIMCLLLLVNFRLGTIKSPINNWDSKFIFHLIFCRTNRWIRNYKTKTQYFTNTNKQVIAETWKGKRSQAFTELNEVRY